MSDLSLADLFGTPVQVGQLSTPKMAQDSRPVRPSAGTRAMYYKKLAELIGAMGRDTLRQLTAARRANPPVVRMLAEDELSSREMAAAVKRLAKKWFKRFDDGAAKLATWFAQKSSQRSDAQLRKILRDAGFTVDFKLTSAQRDVLNAVVGENVALIKSIPRQYFTQIEGAVMRSVALGGDLKALSDFIEKQGRVTRRRAEFIARDQNSKAIGALTRVRSLEAGITEGIWMHSGGGKEPRPTHVRAGRDGVRFDLATGWLDPAEGKRIFPGQLINCRCVYRAVIPGVDE